MSLYLFAILFLSVTPVSLAQNLIDNPGFEKGEGETAQGWRCTANKGNPGFARTDDRAFEGKYSVKLAVKPGYIYARWVYSRPDVDVIPNGKGEVQLRGSVGKSGDWTIYFDDVSLEIIPAELPSRPQPFTSPKGNQKMLAPDQMSAIQCDTSILPLKTAAEELQKFINNRQKKTKVIIEQPIDAPPLRGTLILGTPADNPTLVRWAKEDKLGITEYSDTVDAYEVAELGGCVAIVGTNPRSVLYGVFELEDLLIEHGGFPRDFRSKVEPNLKLRLLHPRARGGFYTYQQNDIEFIARAGGNVAHLSHDWMSEKTLFSFTSCPEFPNAIDPTNLENNRKQLRQYIQWCKMYGLRSALWLCEIICQGGGWVPEATRQAFLNRFPEEVLEDTGTYQGKVLCLAHPLVGKAYRGMIRQFLTDFPEIEILMIFSLDSNGEFCHPDKCPRHKGISKYTQYNNFLQLLLEEGRKIQPEFKVFSVGWSWMFRNDPEYLTQFSALPEGAGLTSPPDGEAWSFDRKITDKLLGYRKVTQDHGLNFIGYDIFMWGDDCQIPETELYDFPLGVAAKLRRWNAIDVDGFFDQWGTQAEYVSNNAIALRYMTFHPELIEPHNAKNFIAGMARKQYGHTAAPHVIAAWSEIEAAQQIQSDHTYYWHELRPNWAITSLRSSLTLDALRDTKLINRLNGMEPSKPYRSIDYSPYSGDAIAASRVLGEVLPIAADHFARADEYFRKAIEELDTEYRSQYEHWYPDSSSNPRPRLTPRQSLEKQLVSVQLHMRNQRRMGLFFAAYSLVQTMPESGQPGHTEALKKLREIQEAEANLSSDN